MATLTLQPSSTGIDTYINQSSPTLNYGTTTTLLSNGSGSAGKKILIKFDISSIPANSVILSATLKLHASSVPGSPTASIFPLAASFFEGSQNGVAPSAGQDGSTWNLRNANGSVAWSGGAGNPGIGALDSAVSVVFGSIAFNVTTSVDQMYRGVIANNGWLISSTNTAGDIIWSSSDSATSSERPQLVITYASKIAASVSATSTATGTASSASGVQSLVLQPDESSSQDTYINAFSTQQGYNFGTSAALSIGEAATLTGHITRTLIKFDLSAIPADAELVSVVLSLYVTGDNSTNARTYRVYRQKRAWVEGSRAGATDSPATGATWTRYDTVNNWQTAGGFGVNDCEQTDIGSLAFSSAETLNQFKDFILTPTTKADLDLGNGWLIKADTESDDNYSFASSGDATASHRPRLSIVYRVNKLAGATSGAATVTGTAIPIGNLRGSSAGSSVVSAQIITNFFSVGHGLATSSASGTLTGIAVLKGNSFGDSAALADIIANFPLQGTVAGTSAHVAHLRGIFRFQGTIAGQGTAVARLSSEGQMRGRADGFSTVTASGYARAISVAAVIGCNPVPLLHITNGSIKPNGQLNILNFLNDRSGYFLVNYKPQIAQYKDGGSWSSSPLSQGRRLRNKVFDNVIDVIEVAARAGSQDALIQYQQDLMAFQEAASDYWASDFAFLPYYLVARAARETNARYAIIHMISCPELENPYVTPFFDDAVGATFTSLTVRIEHGLWTSTPPGTFDCVQASSQREWTVSGWQAGS